MKDTGLSSDLDAVIGEPGQTQTKCANTRTDPTLCMVLGGLKQMRKEPLGREKETSDRQ